MFCQPKKIFTGHIKVLGGPHVARGPDIAQACESTLYTRIVIVNLLA